MNLDVQELLIQTTRLRAEQAFHDWQAWQRADHFQRHPQGLRFADDDYLDHETWIRPAFEALGEVRGRRVLDFGCGHGMAAVVLARRGAQVTAFDLSGGYLTEARRRALANHVAIDFVQADGERLPFADASFDRIWGNAVLHHLDVAQAGRELQRVLAPGGWAVFSEPWGENPFLHWARRRLSYPGKGRTRDEAPLVLGQVNVLRTIFPHVELAGHQLLAMAGRFLGPSVWQRRLAAWDAGLLRRFPRLVNACRYVVLTMAK